MFKQYVTIANAFDMAIYLHCNLAYLQYFKNCNKRTARMMLNVSLKQDDKMLYIPNKEYQETVDAILFIENSKQQEQNRPLRKQ